MFFAHSRPRTVAAITTTALVRPPVRVFVRIVKRLSVYLSPLPRVAAQIVGALKPVRVPVQLLALPPPRCGG